MADINYSFNVGAEAGTTPDSNTWSFCGVKILPGPGNTALLHKIRTGERMMVQPDLAQALQQCTAFKTLEAHAQHIMQLIPALKEHPETVHQTLQTVREKGLLESAETAWTRLSDGACDDKKKQCRLFILTCDRPTALERLLASLQNDSLPADIEGIWIIDDSRANSSVEANARIIDKHRDVMSAPLTHFDLIARSAFIAALIAHHPKNEREVRFLFDRSRWGHSPTYGLARNLALLLSGGVPAVVMDDDIVLEAVQPPLEKNGLRFGAPNDREAVFYESPEALDQHSMAESTPPLTAVLAPLGEELGNILRTHWSGPQDLNGADGRSVNGFSARSRTLLTQCGYWGDAGTGSGNWVFHTSPSSQKRLLNTSEEIENTLGKGCSWHGYRGPTLTSYGVMSALTGLDHTALLPPYFPIGRGEDILFGIMVQRLHPDSVVMNAGWAIPHKPIDDRGQRGRLTSLNAAVDVSLLADWLGREPEDQWGLPPSQRLAGLADEIERLAVMDSDDLEHLISHSLLSKRSGLLNRCLEQLAGMNAAGLDGLPGTDPWREFLNNTREALLNSTLQTETSPLAQELANRVAQGSSLKLEDLKEMGQDFAAAIRVWPELVKTASTLISESH